jgi:hypothetical protein
VTVIGLLRLLILVGLGLAVLGALWTLTGARLKAWARDTEGEPWFAPMPGFAFSLMPVTWQGWLVALGVLGVTFILGLLGATGHFGPPHHFGGG